MYEKMKRRDRQREGEIESEGGRERMGKRDEKENERGRADESGEEVTFRR